MIRCSLILFTLFFIGCEKKEVFNLQEITPISSVEQFQNVMWKDLALVEDQLDSAIIPTLIYNEKTVWPSIYKEYAHQIMEKGKNPGLNIRNIHNSGITGKNVIVGIIDQTLCEGYHSEYKGKILEYYDASPDLDKTTFSMHGPAVASVLVGETVGVAPDAKVYYAATPGGIPDAKYFADALDWLILKNSSLPDGKKIRVVSVSAGPSGENSPFTENRDLWDIAYQRAIDSNILVLDCTGHHRLNLACYYDIFNMNDVVKCKPGWPNSEINNPDPYKNVICAPSSFRTVAEHYEKEDYSFRYCGVGGVSWAVPYVAGVLALGWQVNAHLSNEEIIEILFKTSYVAENEYKIIDPKSFVEEISNNR